MQEIDVTANGRHPLRVHRWRSAGISGPGANRQFQFTDQGNAADESSNSQPD
jgi:hypothetical protein